MPETSQDTIDQMKADMAAENKAALDAARLNAKNNYYKTTLGWGLGAAGNVAGILVAIKRKSGFWRGVGWFFLLGFAGSATGLVIGSVLDGKPKDETPQ